MSEKLSSVLRVRAPDELKAAIDQTADRNLVSRSAYVRTALIERLRTDGVDFGAAARVTS
jgi:predicted transcriptional regulator